MHLLRRLSCSILVFTGKLIRLAAPAPEDVETLAVWTRNDGYMRDVDDYPVRPHATDPDSLGKGDDLYFDVRTRKDENLIGFVALFGLSGATRSPSWRSASAIPATGGAVTAATRWRSCSLRLQRAGLFDVGLTVMDYNTAAIRPTSGPGSCGQARAAR